MIRLCIYTKRRSLCELETIKLSDISQDTSLFLYIYIYNDNDFAKNCKETKWWKKKSITSNWTNLCAIVDYTFTVRSMSQCITVGWQFYFRAKY